MATIADEAVEAVEEALAECGTSIVIDRRTKTPNADTGEPDYGAEADVTVLGHVYPYEARLVDGDVIRAEDLQAIVKAKGLAFIPRQGMRCSFTYATPDMTPTTENVSGAEIVSVEPILVQGVVVAFQFQLRR